MGSRLTRNQIDAICKRVYARFPELQGARPQVKPQQANGRELFLLRFEARVNLSDGNTMRTAVRVIADVDGKVVKMTSGR